MNSNRKSICFIANSDIFFESFLVSPTIALSKFYDIHIAINSNKIHKLFGAIQLKDYIKDIIKR